MKSREHEEFERIKEFKETLEWPQVRTFFFIIDEHSFTLHVGFDLVFHFDNEGRLRRAFVNGKHFLRGMDGRVLRKTIPRRNSGATVALADRQREVADIYALSHESVVEGLRRLEIEWKMDRLEERPEKVEHVLDLLERASHFTPEVLRREEEHFRQIYAPLGVLPPDCYRTLILQATEGCSFNRCAFCSIYRDVPYRKKPVAEFVEHLLKAKEFLGRALTFRRGIFLGEANALEIPQTELIEILEACQELVPEVLGSPPERGRGIHAFSDVFRRDTRSPAEFRDLRDLGLERVYLGVESGNDLILKKLRKPASQQAVRRKAEALKEAGVSLGLIFLVGAGGRELSRAHVEGTLELVRHLPLDRGDILYLSRLTWPGPEFLSRSVGGDRPRPGRISGAELEREEQELAGGLRALDLRVGQYSLSSFIYH